MGFFGVDAIGLVISDQWSVIRTRLADFSQCAKSTIDLAISGQGSVIRTRLAAFPILDETTIGLGKRFLSVQSAFGRFSQMRPDH